MRKPLKTRKKNIVLCLAILIGLTGLFYIGAYTVRKYNSFVEMEGAKMSLWNAGRNISILLLTKEVWKTDNGLMSFHAEWELIRNHRVSKYQKRYYNPDVWTVITNIPENPPDNLIVLATSNVDPSSLRTSLSIEDMQKQIRFVSVSHLPVLNNHAILITADLRSITLRTDWQHRGPHNTTYGYIYGGKPFDVTTNSNGMQVKYVLSDGTEVVPSND